MYYFVGIDIAKYKHDCFIFTSDGEVIRESFSFDNNTLGFNELLVALDKLDHSHQIKIGLEATGIYGNNLKKFITKNGYEFSELNPLQVKRFANSLSNRKTKTDRIDAQIIARFLASVSSRTYVYSSYHNESLKKLSRFRNKLIRNRSNQIVILTNILDIEFPEFKLFFSNKLNSKTALFILKKYKTAKRIAKLNDNEINILHNKSRLIPVLKFKELRDLSINTVGHHYDYNTLIMDSTIKLLEELNKQIEEIESKIKDIISEVDNKILTIPGIGIFSTASIIGEFGDFTRFNNYKQLCAFTGIEPSIYQSGESFHTGRMVKHGSSELRYTLFNIVPTLCIHNETFKDFYFKKIHEGKPYRVAQSHVIKKLLRVIFYLERNHEDFDPSKLI